MKADQARHDARDHIRERKTSKVRRCAFTGEVRPIADLVRFVVGPGHKVVPDISARLPGRGIWITAQHEALEQAISRNVFARSAKMLAHVPEDLAEQVVLLLQRRCLDLLGLARRAGLVSCGFDKVRDLLDQPGARAVITASDASPRSFEKLEWRSADVERVTLFSREELSLALGRPNVVHAALRQGQLSEAFLAEIERLRGLAA